MLVDSVYCCATVLEAAQARGFTLIGLLKRNRRLSDGRRAWDAPEEKVTSLQGLETPVKVVHRGRGKGRRTVICTAPELSRQAILRHLKRRRGIEVLFRLTEEQFGLGECRCRGEVSLERWVEAVFLAYVLVGLTRWGKQLVKRESSWLEVRQEWGERLIPTILEVSGWLATLGRLLVWSSSFFSPLSLSRREQEVVLAP